MTYITCRNSIWVITNSADVSIQQIALEPKSLYIAIDTDLRCAGW